MKDFLKKLLARKKNELEALKKRNAESTDVNELRSIGSQIESVTNEIAETENQLHEIEAEEARAATQTTTTEPETRGAFDPTQAMTTVASVVTTPNTRSNEDPRATMEYRTAFMNYVQRGEVNREVLQFEQRANQVGTSSDLGVLIPTTIMNEIITDVDKIYGQLYRRVRKTNIAGGVKYPLGSFDATFTRITETTVSERQKSGNISGTIDFTYKIGEIRLARTLLQTILSVNAFEQKFAEVIAKAYVRAMDKEIMTGVDSQNQMEGILTEANKSSDSRIPASHIISFTAEEMADWTQWQKKLFAVIPLSMRGLRPEFAMTANTYEANIKTLKDDNNRPLYYETFNPVDGTETATFKSREVVFVENDILADFDTAEDGQYFGMYWVPEEGYAINSNLEFTVVDYFDQETNQYVKKALVINDGKVLKGDYIYLLKKSVTA